MKSNFELIITILSIITALFVLLFEVYNGNSNANTIEKEIILMDAIVLKNSKKEKEILNIDDIEHVKINEKLLPENYDSSKLDIIGKTIKVDLPLNTILNQNYFYELNESIENTFNVMYNNIKFTNDILQNDYVDIRIKISDKEDYIILNSKRVVKINDDEIWFELSTVEQKIMLNAIEQIGNGSILYVEKRRDVS